MFLEIVGTISFYLVLFLIVGQSTVHFGDV